MANKRKVLLNSNVTAHAFLSGFTDTSSGFNLGLPDENSLKNRLQELNEEPDRVVFKVTSKDIDNYITKQDQTFNTIIKNNNFANIVSFFNSLKYKFEESLKKLAYAQKMHQEDKIDENDFRQVETEVSYLKNLYLFTEKLVKLKVNCYVIDGEFFSKISTFFDSAKINNTEEFSLYLYTLLGKNIRKLTNTKLGISLYAVHSATAFRRDYDFMLSKDDFYFLLYGNIQDSLVTLEKQIEVIKRCKS